MLVDFGKANLFEKARQQPDKVKLVLDKVRTDGVLPTIASVQNKLDQPLALGYCNVGIVSSLGPCVTGYAIGDRVASNGKHAGVVSVPVNLCARIPATVSDEQAAFTVVGAIALQGIRLLQPSLGETVVVTGLGLIGLLAVQLLRAHGCRVLGIDFDSAKLDLASQFGAEVVDLGRGQDPVTAAHAFSRSRGADAVLVTAATKSSELMHQAALMCRQRGRIVLVGVAGLELSREDFYKKELTFQVSSSYGPGRYDPAYEEKGHDYPVGFVRWTEQRNFEAVLDMLADGRLDVVPLISHRFPIGGAGRAYELVARGAPSLGILLQYPRDEMAHARTVAIQPERPHESLSGEAIGVSFVGSGNYATSVLIPAFKAAGAALRTVASNSGVSGLHAARKFHFQQTTTDPSSIFADDHTKAVVITTRHDSHAPFVVEALVAGKDAFVEKPLCLTLNELAEIESEYSRMVTDGLQPHLMVGFNRRFAPQVQKIKDLLQGASRPRAFVYTVNAGGIPADHWTQDVDVGGGRIIGECCHFIDLIRFLTGSRITAYSRSSMHSPTSDTVSISLSFADGSIGTVHYFANGSKAYPKERIEVFVGGRVLLLDNFRKLTGYGWPGFKSMNLFRQDKGQQSCVRAFLNALRNGAPTPIPFDEIIEVNRVAIELAQPQ